MSLPVNGARPAACQVTVFDSGISSALSLLERGARISRETGQLARLTERADPEIGSALARLQQASGQIVIPLIHQGFPARTVRILGGDSGGTDLQSSQSTGSTSNGVWRCASGGGAELAVVRFDRPLLREIVATVRRHSPRVLAAFLEFRRRSETERRKMEEFWELSARFFSGTDLIMDLPAGSRDPAALLPIIEEVFRDTYRPSPLRIQRMIDIWRSLAGEQIIILSDWQGVSRPFSYRLIGPGEGSLPVRDGAIPIPTAPFDRALDRFEVALGRLPSGDRHLLRAALVKLEVVRLSGARRGPVDPPLWYGSIRQAFPRLSYRLFIRLVLLHRLVAVWERGLFNEASLFPGSGPLAVRDFLYRAARLFYQNTFPLSNLLDRSPLQGAIHSESSRRLMELPGILKLFRLLPISVRAQQIVIGRIYHKELSWAFPRIEPATDERGPIYVTPGPVDPAVLKRRGLTGLLRRERLIRGWTFRGLMAQMGRHLEGGIRYSRVRKLTEGNARPSLEELQALEIAFKEVNTTGSAPEPTLLFLAAYPEFFTLIRIDQEEPGRPLTEVPIEPRRWEHSPMARVAFEHKEVALDPKGLPAYLRTLRQSHGLLIKEAARWAGISQASVRQMERDPHPHSRTSHPHFPAGITLLTELYEANPEEVLRRHLYSFWRDDPVVAAIQDRSSMGRLFYVDRPGRKILERLLTLNFETLAEILYILRRSITPAVREKKVPFLASQRETADLLGISQPLYREWEAGRLIPAYDGIQRILSAYGLSDNEGRALRQAVIRMRGVRARHSHRPS